MPLIANSTLDCVGLHPRYVVLCLRYQVHAMYDIHGSDGTLTYCTLISILQLHTLFPVYCLKADFRFIRLRFVYE